MRIAICTRLRIPIFICNRAYSSSFASMWNETVVCRCRRRRFGMTEWTQACKLRPQNQGTEGHQHTVGRRIESPIMICLVEVLSSKTFCTSNLISHISVISFHRHTQTHTHTNIFSQEQALSTSTQVKCHWGTYWGVDGRRFPEVQPSMRKKTYSTGCEKSAGGGSHTYIQTSLGGHNGTTGQRFCRWSWAPSTPTVWHS